MECEQVQSASIFDLPEEILVSILKFVPKSDFLKVALTCGQFYEAACQAHRFTLKITNTSLQDKSSVDVLLAGKIKFDKIICDMINDDFPELLKIFQKYGKTVKTLKVVLPEDKRYGTTVNTSEWISLFLCVPNVEKLIWNIDGLVDIGRERASKLVLPKLKHLQVRSILCSLQNFFDFLTPNTLTSIRFIVIANWNAIEKILQNQKFVENIHVAGCFLPEACKHLKLKKFTGVEKTLEFEYEEYTERNMWMPLITDHPELEIIDEEKDNNLPFECDTELSEAFLGMKNLKWIYLKIDQRNWTACLKLHQSAVKNIELLIDHLNAFQMDQIFAHKINSVSKISVDGPLTSSDYLQSMTQNWKNLTCVQISFVNYEINLNTILENLTQLNRIKIFGEGHEFMEPARFDDQSSSFTFGIIDELSTVKYTDKNQIYPKIEEFTIKGLKIDARNLVDALPNVHSLCLYEIPYHIDTFSALAAMTKLKNIEIRFRVTPEVASENKGSPLYLEDVKIIYQLALQMENMDLLFDSTGDTLLETIDTNFLQKFDGKGQIRGEFHDFEDLGRKMLKCGKHHLW